ncbi:phosphoenolpyruvate--protein phosphotransferase [Arthrobacter sp. MYb23]|uniref:phosphoenolpyruvate--protein phosphotransferase n=1 Tax=unclassified Arthrobacter TaxID=235627 RepID=UPI000CFC7C61|nr:MULTISPECIES: phosphoenolpyruvate--protein phosphotransferase [unclassified Arthrobacter]PRB40778.1 phosphoenolpyruvate--protein phosphotransferase [Arthrobacter sp. MYb51]PRB94559.1 phosphoenolpyruvate--protein phosphotransferase [Arthrobacter sp. MYb23]
MQNFQGVGVSPGRIIGSVRQMPKPVSEPPSGERLASDLSPEEAVAGLKAAAQSVHDELKGRADSASGDGKAVLEATALMAKDTMLLKSAAKLINAGSSAERAIWEAGASVSEMLHNLGGYMAERATDVLDVRARIVAELRGVPAPGIPASDTPFILVAEDLAPADTATLNPAVVLALVTSGGGPQSHTAIIARSLGLPAVVAAHGVDSVADDSEVYVDGAAGFVAVSPSEEQRAAATAWAETSATLAEFDGNGTTADGHLVPLLANVGGAKDAVAAAALGAQGVGLFRTEFCFLERDTEPSVDEQAAAYKAVFDAFPGKKVVLRTLDAGADKPLPFLTDASEPNPALGVRGYRTDFTTPGVLERQLEAIARAASESEADVWVMAPMISTAAEAGRFASLCAAAGIQTPGVMVEVPSAALTAATVLREVGFASLGTNDLTQYAMAADRQLGPLAELNTPWQPAVLRLVQLTVEGATQEGSGREGDPKPVGVCGEAAADPALAVVLTGLGVTTLSMTARSLAAVGTVLKTVALEQAQELAQLALSAPSALEARDWVRAKLPVLEELGL